MNKYKGKNLEEVLDIAADGENVDIEYLNYRIVSKKEEEIEIETYFISDVIKYVEDYLSLLLTNLNLKFEIDGQNLNNAINFSINTNHDAILIGKNGRTLQAINDMARVIINNRFGQHFKTLIDIGNYKEDKYEKLIQMARRYAKEVQKTKTQITLHPMPSDERRMVHNAIGKYQNIKTESIGHGSGRKLTIKYVEEEEGS